MDECLLDLSLIHPKAGALVGRAAVARAGKVLTAALGKPTRHGLGWRVFGNAEGYVEIMGDERGRAEIFAHVDLSTRPVAFIDTVRKLADATGCGVFSVESGHQVQFVIVDGQR